MASLQARLAAVPFHLALSAGYFGIFAHAGFVQALSISGLRPRSYSGCSAGALVAALCAAGMPTEEIRDELNDLRRRDFWDPGFGLGLLKGRKLERRIAEFAPVPRLEDCPQPIAISVLNLKTRTLEVRRSGDLARTVHASLAIFPLFMPVRCDGALLADGGAMDRPALAGVGAQEVVLCHDLKSRSGAAKAPPKCFSELYRLQSPGVPKLGPFKLGLGPVAHQIAHDATLRALAAERPETQEMI